MAEIHELITRRWSPVAFDAKPINYDKIHLLFEAAKWAPSGRNGQPWRFIFATREMPDFKVLLDLLDEDNQVWAKTAPMLVLALAQVISTYKNRPNRLAFYETGMAVSNLLIQATHMDLYVHQMAGYDVERAKEMPKKRHTLSVWDGHRAQRGRISAATQGCGMGEKEADQDGDQ